MDSSEELELNWVHKGIKGRRNISRKSTMFTPVASTLDRKHLLIEMRRSGYPNHRFWFIRTSDYERRDLSYMYPKSSWKWIVESGQEELWKIHHPGCRLYGMPNYHMPFDQR